MAELAALLILVLLNALMVECNHTSVIEERGNIFFLLLLAYLFLTIDLTASVA